MLENVNVFELRLTNLLPTNVPSELYNVFIPDIVDSVPLPSNVIVPAVVLYVPPVAALIVEAVVVLFVNVALIILLATDKPVIAFVDPPVTPIPVIVPKVPEPSNVIVPFEYVPPVAALIVVVVAVPNHGITLKILFVNVVDVIADAIKPVILLNEPLPVGVIVPFEYVPPVAALIVVAVVAPPLNCVVMMLFVSVAAHNDVIPVNTSVRKWNTPVASDVMNLGSNTFDAKPTILTGFVAADTCNGFVTPVAVTPIPTLLPVSTNKVPNEVLENVNVFALNDTNLFPVKVPSELYNVLIPVIVDNVPDPNNVIVPAVVLYVPPVAALIVVAVAEPNH